jgi:DNA-binding MarR family transcriptional regulator
MSSGHARPGESAARPPDLEVIAEAMRQMAYLFTRYRYHNRIQAATGVPLARAAVAVLLTLAHNPPMRIGELAGHMDVEPPHVTRQVRLLENAGYVTRSPDPEDRRAQTVHLTASGRRVAERIRQAGLGILRDVLEGWSDEDVHRFAGLFRRIVDGFVAGALRDEAAAERAALEPGPA